MEQILYIFTYFPYLAISLILFGIIIGLLLAAFLQIGQPTIIHNIFHQPAQESADYKGCFIRIASLLAICIITISLLLSYAPTFALSPLPTDQAKALLQTYYNDLNKKDYQAAYNLFKHCRQSYNQFTADFAPTEHSAPSFNSIKQLSDGTVEAIVTVHAEEKTLPPGHYNIYTFLYIAGEDQGTPKLLKGYTLSTYAQYS